MIVASYDADGNLRWKNLFGSFFDDVFGDMAIDGGGNLFLTGYTRNTMPGGATHVGASGDWNTFVARIDSSNGSEMWSTQFGPHSKGQSIAVDSNYIYVASSISDQITLNDDGVFTLL